MKKLLILLAAVFSTVALHAGEYPDISITRTEDGDQRQDRHHYRREWQRLL